MKSLREIVESSPQMRAAAMHSLRHEEEPQPLGPALWDWADVRSVLIIRLRSIGDTVLTTPSLYALKRFLPHARLDILLEDWVAPVLEGFSCVDNIITLKRGSAASRARVAHQLRSLRYDVAYNFHGGTTATLLTRASGAKRRVGYATYQYRRLYTHLAPSPILLWKRDKMHSVEQQLALLGWTGVPVQIDRRPSWPLPSCGRERCGPPPVRGLTSNGPSRLFIPRSLFYQAMGDRKFAKVAEYLAARTRSRRSYCAESAQLAEQLKEHSRAGDHIYGSFVAGVTALAGAGVLFVGNNVYRAYCGGGSLPRW